MRHGDGAEELQTPGRSARRTAAAAAAGGGEEGEGEEAASSDWEEDRGRVREQEQAQALRATTRASVDSEFIFVEYVEEILSREETPSRAIARRVNYP
jgi:hypothetical protein